MIEKTKRDRVWIKIFEYILAQEKMKPIRVAEEVDVHPEVTKSAFRSAEEAGFVYRKSEKGKIYYPKNIFELFGIEKSSGGDTE